MSRIGKKPIEIPSGVKVKITGSVIQVKGPLGKLERTIPDMIEAKKKENEIIFILKDEKFNNYYGLTRSLVANMIEGVSKGIEKVLEINGTGYRAALEGENLTINIGFSHPVKVSDKAPPGVSEKKTRTSKWIRRLEGIKFNVNPNGTVITINGIDKQVVGQMAALIRAIKPPEPYKGKGIKYRGEWIRRKAGKAAATAN